MAPPSFKGISWIVGKPVIDESGREVGRVLSFFAEDGGRVDRILVMDAREEYACYSLGKLRFIGDKVALVSELERRAKMLEEEIPLLRRKKDVLKKLSEENQVLPEVYEKIMMELDSASKKLMSEAESLIGEVEKEIDNYNKQLRMLHLAKTFLEIEHRIGNLEEETYKQSLTEILNGLKRVSNKQLRFREIKGTLTKVLTEGSSSVPKSPTEEKQKEAEEVHVPEKQEELTPDRSESSPVITVHMKNLPAP